MDQNGQTTIDMQQGGGNIIPRRSIFGYGLGSAGISLIWMTIDAFLAIYLTDIVGMPALLVGNVIIISRFLGGCTDFLIGLLVDKTKTRWGRTRPWILMTAPLLGVSFVLLFSVPVNLPVNVVVSYVFVMFNLTTTVFYSAANVPYSTLLSLLGGDSYQRSLTNLFRSGTQMLSIVAIAFCFQASLKLAGGGHGAWTTVTALIAILAVLLLTGTGLLCKERQQAAAPILQESIPLWKKLKLMLSNGQVWINFFLAMITNVLTFPGLSIYYLTHVLNRPEAFGLVSITLYLPSVLLLFVMTKLIRRFGKKWMVIIGILVASAGNIMMLIDPTDLAIVLAGSLIRGVGITPYVLLQFAIVSDTAEYSFHKTGIHGEGFINSFCMLGSKWGSGLGTAIVAWTIAFYGYDGLTPVQNPAVISAIKNLYICVPAILSIVCAVLCVFYKAERFVSATRNEESR
jgi:GPH family glycoside/pentoside/hexuronide:cation symporter